MKYFWRVLRYLTPHWHLAAVTAGLTLVVTFFSLLAPWPLKILFDSVLGSHPMPGPVESTLGHLRDRPYWLLSIIVAAGLGITILENGFAVANSYVQTWLQQRLILSFRSDLFQHAQRLSLSYHDQRRSGVLIHAINVHADAAAGLVMAVQPLAQSVLMLVGMFAIAVTINWQLALLAMVVVPFLYYSIGYYVKHIQGRLWQVKEMEAETLSIIHEAMSMIRVVVAFGREGHEYSRFRQQGERALEARVKLTVRQTLFSLAVNTTTAAGLALVLGFAVYQIMEGRMTGGELLIMLTYVGSIYGPLKTISATVGSLQDRFVSTAMAYAVLDTQPKIRNEPGAVTLESAAGDVTFDQVSFSYEGRLDTLTDINFHVPAGRTVGIVGPTGAGKSTLVSLIPRFCDPTGGRVLLDGRDLRELRLESLRRQIGVVLQEALLFSGTIAENIRYAKLEASMDEVIGAAKAANAHDFIMRLPQQYETELGERGAQVSGGERQRISIARAFLKNAPILILDEPTSAIDSRTESIILDALKRLMAGRTTFVIAHRLSSIREADLILVMDHGRIVEQGSHEELMQREGLYRQLHDIQSGTRAATIPLPSKLEIASVDGGA
jgi:ATP-binding cassette, subfamily B, bacterial